MAILIPELDACLSRMSSGEKQLARQLEALLEDDYLCWYDVAIARQQRHPDFLLLNPQRGLLALEVRDWHLDNLLRVDAEQVELELNGSVQQQPNPLRKAQDFMLRTADLLKRDPLLCTADGDLIPPIGYGVLLSQISRAEFEQAELAEVMSATRVICQDELEVDAERFQQRLWQMFERKAAHCLTLPQQDRIRWHLFPEIRLAGPRQGQLIEAEAQAAMNPLPELIRVMNVEQEQLARSLGEGHRVIHGVAGSGKTMILGYRAEYLAQRGGKPVLLLCYNRELAQKLAVWMDEKGLSQQVVVRTFFAWCRDMLRSYQLREPAQGERYFDEMVQEVIAGVQRGQVPRGQYGALLIDEGHDFQAEWLKLVVQMIDPRSNSLLLMCDSAQEVYHKARKQQFSFASVGIQAQGRTTVLKLNYRNTAEVLAMAHDFAHDLLQADSENATGFELLPPQSASRHGQLPEFAYLPSFEAEIDYLAEKLHRLLPQGRHWREMAFLLYFPQQKAQVIAQLEAAGIPTTEAAELQGLNAVRVLSIHAAKGLEFPVVAIPGLGLLPHPQEEIQQQARALYIGMTRAQELLLLSADRESLFAQRMQIACTKLPSAPKPRAQLLNLDD